jgi:uncharacterized protein YndB with AHSA1/START domain
MIRRQIVMPVSPDRLWQALTDPDEMAGWFGARVEWTLEEDSPARFLADDGSQRAGRVEVVRPGRHLRFRWWPTDGAEPTGMPDVAGESEDAEQSEVAGESQVARRSGAATAAATGAAGAATGPATPMRSRSRR